MVDLCMRAIIKNLSLPQYDHAVSDSKRFVGVIGDVQRSLSLFAQQTCHIVAQTGSRAL